MTGEAAQGLLAAKDCSPELMVTIRVYPSILYMTKAWAPQPGEERIPLEPEHIDTWMKLCAEGGVTTVLWRSNTGWTTFPSKIVPFAGTFPLPATSLQAGVSIVKQGWLAEDWAFLGEQCKRFNTLAVAVEAAHRHGMKILLDFATFDAIGVWCNSQYWPEGGDLAWDPDMWMWSKDQKQRLAGVPCYAEPAVRELKVREIEEVTDYDIDGVRVSLHGHMDGAGGDDPCSYGYNPTVVNQYKQLHGVDPLTEEVDPHKFYELHGEGFTEFMRRVSRVVHGKGKKLIGSTRTDGVHGWGGEVAGKALVGLAIPDRDMRDGKSPLPIAAGFYLQSEKWAEERLVDGLMCAVPSTDGVKAAQRLRDKIGLPVYIWRKYNAHQGSVFPLELDVYQSETEAVRAGEIDGYAMFNTDVTDHPLSKPDWRDLYRKR